MQKLAVAGGSILLLALAAPARAGTITAAGAVKALVNVSQLVGVVGHGDFDEGPPNGFVTADVYAAQGLTWQSGSMPSLFPGIVPSCGDAGLPQYGQWGYFPAPIGGGGVAGGLSNNFAGVASFSITVTQVGLTASNNGTQYLTAWDASYKLIGQVTWQPAGDAAFVGIDTLGVPIGVIAYGNDDIWAGQCYDLGGVTNISDAWIWATGSVKQCTSSAQCDDGNPCTDDTCSAQGICLHEGNTAPCNDGNACTKTDVCSGGTCKGTDPVSCLALDGCHVAGVCDMSTGTCTNPAKPNGSACSDGDACTLTDTCTNGVCSGANPVMCPPAGQCYVAGSCDLTTGKCTGSPEPDGKPCDDGDACTMGDACLGGSCAGTSTVSCPDTDACHDVGTCNPATGQCTSPTPVPNGTPCPGGTCESGVCTPEQTGTGGSPAGTGGSGTGGSFPLWGRAGCHVPSAPPGAAPGVGILMLLALRRRRATRQLGHSGGLGFSRTLKGSSRGAPSSPSC